MQSKVQDRDETIKELEKELRIRDTNINELRGDVAQRDQAIG